MAVHMQFTPYEHLVGYDINNIHSEETSQVPLVNTMHHDEVDWDSGICGCVSCDRPWICFMAFVCPCLLFGEISDGLKDKTGADTKATGTRCNFAAFNYFLFDCSLVGIGLILTNVCGISVPTVPSLSCCIHNRTRRAIRQRNPQRLIVGSCLSDVLLTFFCSCCVLVQEHTQIFPLALVNK